MDSAQRPPLIPMRPMKLPMKVSLVAALALWLVLVALNQPLHTAAAPQGIVSLQLAGTAEQTHAILRSWRDGNLAMALRFAAMALVLEAMPAPHTCAHAHNIAHKSAQAQCMRP